MRAIIVDDSRGIRVLLRGLLRGLGIEVAAEAGDGREAIARLAEVGPLDLALVDWNMPEMNGYELLTTLRAEARWSSMRVMMVTTEAEATRIVAALDAGADEYLLKPFDGAALRSKLELMGMVE